MNEMRYWCPLKDVSLVLSSNNWCSSKLPCGMCIDGGCEHNKEVWSTNETCEKCEFEYRYACLMDDIRRKYSKYSVIVQTRVNGEWL